MKFYTRLIIIFVIFILPVSALATPKYKIAIMDFKSIDVKGKQQYLRHTDKELEEPQSLELTEEERSILSKRELKEYAKATIQEKILFAQEKRAQTKYQNARERQDKKDFQARMVSSKAGRRIIYAADLMASELSKYPDLFELVDRKGLEENVMELEFQRNGLVNQKTSKQLGQMTGATHLVRGVVDDYQKEERKFQGYGVKTNQITYTLPVTVEIVEIETGRSFSIEKEGKLSELKTSAGSHTDQGLEKKLLKNALKKIAKEMYARLSPAPSVVAPVSIPKVHIAPVDAKVLFMGSIP